MSPHAFPFEAIGELTFQSRPGPVPASLRPLYRMALIVLVLELNCRGNTASLIKLQFFNWLIKNPSFRRETEGRGAAPLFSIALPHMDPMVNLALKYAWADGLVSVTENGKYRLTPRGHNLASRVIAAPDGILHDEREFLAGLGRRVSETGLQREFS